MRQQKDYQTTLAKLLQLPTLLKQRTVENCVSLEQILYNSYTGISSHFLIEQIEKRGGNIL